MNQEKVGKKIKEIRKKNHLTQQQFADKYGVTYQAVSKWENGKNIPDIAILKEICEEYQMNFEELFDVTKPNSKKKKNKYFYFIFAAFLLLILFVFFVQKTSSNDFEFRTLSSSCDNFQVSGSLAYNDKKSVIYISNISYCGAVNKEKYHTIQCTLYETHGQTKTVVSQYDYKEDKLITLEAFLEKVNFHLDDYTKTCKNYSENSFHLEIDATDEEGKITSYKVPLKLDNSCKN